MINEWGKQGGRGKERKCAWEVFKCTSFCHLLSIDTPKSIANVKTFGMLPWPTSPPKLTVYDSIYANVEKVFLARNWILTSLNWFIMKFCSNSLQHSQPPHAQNAPSPSNQMNYMQDVCWIKMIFKSAGSVFFWPNKIHPITPNQESNESLSFVCLDGTDGVQNVVTIMRWRKRFVRKGVGVEAADCKLI